jgi:hypothetical protein
VRPAPEQVLELDFKWGLFVPKPKKQEKTNEITNRTMSSKKALQSAQKAVQTTDDCVDLEATATPTGENSFLLIPRNLLWEALGSRHAIENCFSERTVLRDIVSSS